MLEPYSAALDAFCARKALPNLPPVAARAGFPDSSHPLTRIDRMVENVCAEAPATAGASTRRADVRVIRAAILQSLYSFGCNELLLEHLRYNSLYRWFVGLQDGEPLWSSATYAEALGRILRSPDTAAMLRRSLICAQSCAAICPDRFCVDRSLIERWTTPAREPVAHGASFEPAANELCRARLERAREIILRRIGDHDLTPESIAAEMCMSRRALFLLFEKNGLTPTRVIRDMRLDHCRRLLADARHRQRKVTDIAMDFGFAHPGTFSRQFKDRFGISPIEVRFGARSTHNDFRGVRFGRYAEVAAMS